MMNQVTVIEKCEVLDANAPKWELYMGSQLVDTVREQRFLNATVTYWNKKAGIEA